MTEHADDRGAGARLVELVVADEPEAWADAGFTVGAAPDGGAPVVRVGPTAIRLIGPDDGERGITRWRLAGLSGAPEVTGSGRLDGLPTDLVDLPGDDVPAAEDGGPDAAPAPTHPNGVVGLDHVVVATPDLERTIAALGAVGLSCRRIRETTSYGRPMRQAFFRLGPTLIEVVSGATGTGEAAADAPATWFGLAVDVDDLDRTAALLGDGLGSIKAAVQDGRRIATVRHRTFGLSVALAAMDDHGDR